MYYINPEPTENGNYGNPQSNYVNGMLLLPDDLLPAYLESMGFVTLTVESGAVTAVERNEEAYNSWQAAHPAEPDPETEPSANELLNALLGVMS